MTHVLICGFLKPFKNFVGHDLFRDILKLTYEQMKHLLHYNRT